MLSYENEYQKTVIENAAECTVLLKSNGDFPIDGPCKIAAYGAGLRHTIMGGTGSGEVNTKISYTIEEGLEREGFTITSKKWLDEYDRVREAAKKPYYEALKKEARQNHENVFLFTMGREMTEPEHNIEFDGEGDVAIYVLSRNSGEGSDRRPSFGDVKLAGSEVRDITLLRKKYRRFMLVLNVGGVVDLSPVKDVENILLLSQLCTDCGRVLSDILTGKQTPSGKLTTTWAAWESYSREGTFGDWNETRYNEGIYVGY
ncbi:MAG: glycoside hydrolase family 3 C-terminal domain-containing protein, partial [Lachnospiraceae bacterium]|nr:glycoside hydrolase family 3 C-terminal domain-containing protein [Lachnospiraceae bacterium]